MDTLSWVQLLTSGEAGWCGRRKHQVVSHRNYLYLMGGYCTDNDRSHNLNDVWRSPDGSTWTQLTPRAPWTGRDGHTALEHQDAIYLMGGTQDLMSNNNDVWRTTNGVNWVELTRSAGWEGRWQHAAVSHCGAIYVMGGWSADDGYMQDVWRTVDGRRWTRVCAAAPWGKRMFHAVVSLQDKMYLMGGTNGSLLNDVWASTDGREWQLVTRSAQWSPRTGHSAVNYNGKIFLCGGADAGGTALAGGWMSADGARWTQCTADFEARRGHAAVVHGGTILIMGGLGPRDDYLNDCYRTVSAGDFEGIGQEEEVAIEPVPRRNSRHHVIEDELLRTREDSSSSRLRATLSLSPPRSRPLSRSGTISSPPEVRRQLSVAYSSIIENLSDLAEKRKQLEQIQHSNLELLDAIDAAVQAAFQSDCTSGDMSDCASDTTAGQDTPMVLDESMATSPSAEELSPPPEELRTAVERMRGELRSLQRQIKTRARAGESAAVNELLAPRAKAASIALPFVRQLSIELERAVEVAGLRQSTVMEVLEMLESRAAASGGSVWERMQGIEPLGPPPPSPGVAALPAWMRDEPEPAPGPQTLTERFELLKFSLRSESGGGGKGVSADSVAVLADAVSSAATQMAQIAQWVMEAQQSTSVERPQDEITAAASNALEAARHLDAGDMSIARMRFGAHRAITEELRQMPESCRRANELASELLLVGHEYLAGVLTDVKARASELALLAQDMEAWGKLVEQWADADGVSQRVQGMVAAATRISEQVLDLEDKVQDCSSSLMKRRRRGAVGDEIESLKQDLSHAQAALASARRERRRLQSDVAGFAHAIAPEIVLHLPEVVNPLASQAIEGVNLGSMKLPVRSLTDYENLRPMPGGSGRHRMFLASLDEEQVVLKGYVLVSDSQRRSLERELSILSRIKHGAIIETRALVEDHAGDSTVPMLYIELPYCAMGTLINWRAAAKREHWELQGAFRQVLCGVMYLHDRGIIHKDIKPANILVHQDGRVLLSDFDISTDTGDGCLAAGSIATVTNGTGTGGGTAGFMAPEVVAGESATFASDMFSLGCVLFWLHYPDHPTGPVAGALNLNDSEGRKGGADHELGELLMLLLAVTPSIRPTAANALIHEYFRVSLVDRMLEDGALLQQDTRLDAVRTLFSAVRGKSGRGDPVRWNIHRDPKRLVPAVLAGLKDLEGAAMRRPLRVVFEGEAGVDEGGMLSEMFTLFFQAILEPSFGLFETCEGVSTAPTTEEADWPSPTDERRTKRRRSLSESTPAVEDSAPVTAGLGWGGDHWGRLYLPTPYPLYTDEQLEAYMLIGRAAVKCLYAGRRVGGSLAPSLFKYLSGAEPTLRDLTDWDPQAGSVLRWVLAVSRVRSFGFHFEDVGRPELGPVTDVNKRDYVKAKVLHTLVGSREGALKAIRNGAEAALTALSPDAAPFLRLLSHADWRLLLCGEAHVSGSQVAAVLEWHGFPPTSQVPQWLQALIVGLNEDLLRRFLIFVCGCPSLPSGGGLRITVRCQPRSAALPIAHTCFLQLDLPDYASEAVLKHKLLQAITSTASFDVI